MEVLFCFLKWVSSFHTVDDESGNKMDTWNLATVMAPNILRENNDKEMKNIDQAAVKIVHELIENNDEFCEVCTSPVLGKGFAQGVQVPEEIVDLLTDDSSPELTPKEIMRLWEQRGKNPDAAQPIDSSPRNQSAASSRRDQRNAPQITQADNNPQAWAGESSVRHVGGGFPPNHGQMSAHNSPPQGYDLATPNLPYSQQPPGSTESHRTASPHRHSYRSPAFQKQTPLGTAGAG